MKQSVTTHRATLIRNSLTSVTSVTRVVLCFLLLLLCVACVGQSAQAAFLNGVETFDGTTLDATTWEPRFLSDTDSLTQNDELTMATWVIGEFGYSTREITLVAGQSVRATATITDNGNPLNITNASLRISTKDSVDGLHYDSLNFYINIDEDRSYISSIINTRAEVIADDLAVLGQTYVLELERLSDSSMRFSAFDDQGTLLGSHTRDHAPVGELFITLSARGGSATFDNITIIPEPATLMLLAMAVAAVLLCGGKRQER